MCPNVFISQPFHEKGVFYFQISRNKDTLFSFYFHLFKMPTIFFLLAPRPIPGIKPVAAFDGEVAGLMSAFVFLCILVPFGYSS